MKIRSRASLAMIALLVTLMVMSVVMPAAAQQGKRGGVIRPETGERLESVFIASDLESNTVTLADGRIQVIVVLAGEPAVADYIAAGGRLNRDLALRAAEPRQAQIRAAQSSFISGVRSLGADVVGSNAFLINSVTLTIRPDQVRVIASLPGVTGVYPNSIFERNDTTSVPLIGAPTVWDGTYGGTPYTGEGVIIGVVDTGIDYTHVAFGGTGDYADAGDTTIVETIGTPADMFPAPIPSTLGAPKVIGGFDYVGDDYDASGDEGSTVASPDPDPVDCPVWDGGGHGSHVSGSAAAWGMTSAGETFTGPFDSTIYTDYPNPSLATLYIGPGVAPEASLVALRVFGCNGSVGLDIILSAMEDAVAGNAERGVPPVDVVNFSLGSSYGPTWESDPYTVVQQNAADAGVVFVASAGNSGEIALITGRPGASNPTTSVASTLDTNSLAGEIVRIENGDSAGSIFAASVGAMSVPFSTFTDDIVKAAPFNACTPLTNAASVAGKIAFVTRGSCTFVTKANELFAAGATGMILMNNQAGVISMATDPSLAVGYDLPSVSILQADGGLLDAALTALPTLSVSIALDVFNAGAEAVDTASSFTSRGGIVRGNNDLTLKPNLSAPGNTITSARAGTGNRIYVISGTSMASPHVAGFMAVLREAYPSYTVAQLKALAMNTANADVALSGTNPALVSPQRVGSGRVDLAAAVSSTVIAYATDNPDNVSLSFGFPKIVAGDTLVVTKTITLQNLGATDMAYEVSYDGRSDMLGTEFTVSPSFVTVPAGGTITVDVTLTSNPDVAGVNAQTDPTFSVASKYFFTEESGLVIFSPAPLRNGEVNLSLRVPVYAAPQVASDISVEDTLVIGSATEATLTFSGTGVDTSGTYTLGGGNVVSASQFFELAAISPNDAGPQFDPGTGDVELSHVDAGDIQYVGVTSDLLAGGTYVYFAVSTYGEWNTLAETTFYFWIDTDFDDDPEWLVYNSRTRSGAATDNFPVFFVDLKGLLGYGPGAAFIDGSVNGLSGATHSGVMKNNVLVLPFDLGYWEPFAGLTPDAFAYWVTTDTADNYSDFWVDEIYGLSYDPLNPTYSFNDLGGQFGGPYTGLPLWLAVDGDQVPVDFVLQGAGNLADILVIHHHNADPATRAQVVNVQSDALEDFVLLSPADGSFVRDPADITTITWEDSGAAFYTFTLTHISTNTRGVGDSITLADLTRDLSDDELDCDGTVCTLTVPGPLALDDGQYSWTVTASSLLGGGIEAYQPFGFTVYAGDCEYVLNGGFEEGAARIATDWTGKRSNLDPTNAATGGYFALLNLGNPVMKQTVQASSNPCMAALTSADLLTLSADIKTVNNGTQTKVVLAKVFYTDGTRKVLRLDLSSGMSTYGELTTDLALTNTVTKIKVKIKNRTGGKIYVDNVSLINPGVGVILKSAGDTLPLPEVPGGFRGNN